MFMVSPRLPLSLSMTAVLTVCNGGQTQEVERIVATVVDRSQRRSCRKLSYWPTGVNLGGHRRPGVAIHSNNRNWAPPVIPCFPPKLSRNAWLASLLLLSACGSSADDAQGPGGRG